MPSPTDIASHDSFLGIYKGTQYFMVKNPKNVDEASTFKEKALMF